MQDFHYDNILKQLCSVICMMHWQTVSVFTFAQYLACRPVFVILKSVQATSGNGPFFFGHMSLRDRRQPKKEESNRRSGALAGFYKRWPLWLTITQGAGPRSVTLGSCQVSWLAMITGSPCRVRLHVFGGLFLGRELMPKYKRLPDIPEDLRCLIKI